MRSKQQTHRLNDPTHLALATCGRGTGVAPPGSILKCSQSKFFYQTHPLLFIYVSKPRFLDVFCSPSFPPAKYVTLWRKWRERERSHLLPLVVINVKEDNDDMETDHRSTQETRLQSTFLSFCFVILFFFSFYFPTRQKQQWGRFGLDLAWITTAQILLVLLKPQNVPVVSLSSQWIFNNLLSSPHCFLVCAGIWQCWQ